MQARRLCRHFGICGGCAHQDLPDPEYRALKRKMLAAALSEYGLAGVHIAETVEVGPGTRRRAAFKAANTNGRVRLGFYAAASHEIVDMRECRVLTPRLFALVSGLRMMAGNLLGPSQTAELFVVEAENGADVAMEGLTLTPVQRSSAARWAARLKLARLTAEGEVLADLAQPRVTFGKASVVLPPNAFLQATEAGEKALQAAVKSIVNDARRIVDLFAGCGTFSFILAEKAKVHAVDLRADALEALAAAARLARGLKPITTERRNLSRHPLQVNELARYDAAVLDPPRAGAMAQVKELARSRIARIAYVSCDAATFARDAGVLVREGYRLDTVTPVDQFLWSSHIELVAGFAWEQPWRRERNA